MSSAPLSSDPSPGFKCSLDCFRFFHKRSWRAARGRKRHSDRFLFTSAWAKTRGSAHLFIAFVDHHEVLLVARRLVGVRRVFRELAQQLPFSILWQIVKDHGQPRYTTPSSSATTVIPQAALRSMGRSSCLRVCAHTWTAFVVFEQVRARRGLRLAGLVWRRTGHALVRQDDWC